MLLLRASPTLGCSTAQSIRTATSGQCLLLQAAPLLGPTDPSQPPTVVTFNVLQALREEDSLAVTGAGRRELGPLTLFPQGGHCFLACGFGSSNLIFNGKEMQFICQLKGSLAV